VPTFMNPPYSRGVIDNFMKKAYESSLTGAVVVCLIPFGGDGWFIEYCLKAALIELLARVKFCDVNGIEAKTADFKAVCVVVFDQKLRDALPIFPVIYESPDRYKRKPDAGVNLKRTKAGKKALPEITKRDDFNVWGAPV